MPTTRAARSAARRAARCLAEALPADALGLVLYQLPLAHDIAATAPTCHALDAAVKLALKLRPFSGEVVTLAGHTGSVRSVATLPDGRVLTGSVDRTIKVWRDGACERIIDVDTGRVNAVAVLPGGARFISGSSDRTAKLWTLDGAHERTFEVGSNVWCIAALPDGMHFVVGVDNIDKAQYDIRLYNIDGTFTHSFTGVHTDHIGAVAVTTDGRYIISGSADRTVKVWSVATKSLVSTCAGHTSHVFAVAAMPDGKRLLSGGWDYTIRVWLLNGTLENTFSLHNNSVYALVALPDNQHALSGSSDETVKLFNVDDGAVVRTFTHHTGPVFSLALLPDGLRFVSGSHDKTTRIVDIW